MTELAPQVEAPNPGRPRVRNGITHRFKIFSSGEGGELAGYLTINEWDGEPKEIFIASAKQGSLVHGLTDSLAIMVSVALQQGMSVYDVCSCLIDVTYEPFGTTNDPRVPRCKSLSDYIARRIAATYCTADEIQRMGAAH